MDENTTKDDFLNSKYCKNMLDGKRPLYHDHIRSVRLGTNIIEYRRNTDKYLIMALIESEKMRAELMEYSHEVKLFSICPGSDDTEKSDNCPTIDEFVGLIELGIDPCDIWFSVVMRVVAEHLNIDIPRKSWMRSLSWVKSKPEIAARVMEMPKKNRLLILFDAPMCEGISDDHKDNIIRGLLRLVLWSKCFKGIYVKVLMPEKFSSWHRPVMNNFIGASKLNETKVRF